MPRHWPSSKRSSSTSPNPMDPSANTGAPPLPLSAVADERTMTEPLRCAMIPDSHNTRALLDRFDQGDKRALSQLLVRYRADMHAIIEARLDPRVRGRVDPSDVVQQAQMEVVRRIDDFLKRRPMPF